MRKKYRMYTSVIVIIFVFFVIPNPVSAGVVFKKMWGIPFMSAHLEKTYTGLCRSFTRMQNRIPFFVFPYFCRENVLPSPEPEPDPEPELSLDHIVISEIFYDVDSEHGAEYDNEWVELYNGTETDVDISGWIIDDANGTQKDALPEGTIISDGGFLVITASDTTISFWTIPIESPVVVLPSRIGNGLANGEDTVFLKNAEETVVDEITYNSQNDVAEGHSLARKSLTEDTNSLADWEEKEIPNPGEF